MKKKFLSFFIILGALLVMSFPLTAEINLLSPIEGTWANRQTFFILLMELIQKLSALLMTVRFFLMLPARLS